MKTKNTNYRRAVPVNLRVAVAIHYFTQGRSIRNSDNFFRVAYSTLRDAYQDLLFCLCNSLLEEYIKWPVGREARINIA